MIIYYVFPDGTRIPYAPGADLSQAPDEVKAMAATMWTAEAVATWRESIRIEEGEPVIPPNWEGLVSAVMGNPEFKAAWIAASEIDPPLAWSLATAFGMVGQGHPGNFINLFEAMCLLAQVTPEQRGIWADIGAVYNAPDDFLDIVRGNNGE